MDKVQKQLYDTYFRKRKIANEQERDEDGQYDEFGYTRYEVGYILTHDVGFKLSSYYTQQYVNTMENDELDKIDINKLPHNIAAYVLATQFRVFYPKISSEKLKEFDGHDIYVAMYFHPEIVDRVDLKLVVDPSEIYQLANKAFKNMLFPDIYNISDLNKIISGLDLKKMGDDNISILLSTFPQLRKFLYKK